MHKGLHPTDDIERLYMWREGGRALHTIKVNVDTLKRWLKDNIKMSKEKLITETRSNANNTTINRKNKKTNNNLETGMGRKIIVWTFQTINKWNITSEKLDMAKKVKT